MACIKAETGTLVFAIINIIVVTFSTALSIGVLIWAVTCLVIGASTPMDGQMNTVLSVILMVGGTISWIAFSLLTLVFSSFLLNGSLKNKPEHIKAYYIYGVIIVMISAIIFVSVCAVNNGVDAVLASIAVLIYVIYCMILYMLRFTYTKLDLINNQFGHAPLVEKC